MVPILGSFSEARGLAKHNLELDIWNLAETTRAIVTVGESGSAYLLGKRLSCCNNETQNYNGLNEMEHYFSLTQRR